MNRRNSGIISQNLNTTDGVNFSLDATSNYGIWTSFTNQAFSISFMLPGANPQALPTGIFNATPLGVGIEGPRLIYFTCRGTAQPLALFKNTTNTPCIELQDSAATPNPLVAGVRHPGALWTESLEFTMMRQAVNRTAIYPARAMSALDYRPRCGCSLLACPLAEA